MSIIDNERVKKYFGEGSPCEHLPFAVICNGYLALNILRAMQEPIRDGERYLWWKMVPEIMECRDDEMIGPWHPDKLRLPDRFQKKECCTHRVELNSHCCRCSIHPLNDVPKQVCGHGNNPEGCICRQPQRDEVKCKHGLPYCVECKTEGKWQITGKEFECDEVEEKIQCLLKFAGVQATHGFPVKVYEDELRELVRMARRTK